MTDGPATLAYQLAQQAHALNTATEKPSVFAGAADVRDVAEGLHLAVEQLPQALEQLSAGICALEEQAPAGNGGTDGGASAPLRGLLNARQALVVARGELRGVVEALAGACGPVVEGV
ncbi:hypothetical protein Srufu_080110 (plasmid) [Streptomyces libani subsp. rufus]|nr:hypothetical protein Srufu_080110 [Streptomyces libani subsp. rufus]